MSAVVAIAVAVCLFLCVLSLTWLADAELPKQTTKPKGHVTDGFRKALEKIIFLSKKIICVREISHFKVLLKPGWSLKYCFTFL